MADVFPREPVAAIKVVVGALVCSGQDFHNILDQYSFAQITALAQCIWQYEVTRMNVVAYAVGGSEARERVASPDASTPQGDQRSIGWEKARGEWRLYERASDGTVRKQRPKGTPEQAEANYNKALTQMFGVQQSVAQMSGKAPGPPAYLKGKAKGGSADALSDMRAQFTSTQKPGGV